MKLSTIETRAVNLAITVYRLQVQKWVGELQSLKAFDSHINLSPLDISHQKLLEKTIMLSYLQGIDDEKREIESQLAEGKEEFKESITGGDWETVGFDDALLKLKKKGIISPQKFKAASAKVKEIAWSVQRIERMNALEAVKGSLLWSIDSGMSLRDWKGQLPEIFTAYGVTPLSPRHIETVYRTNLGSVYNMARIETSMEDDNVMALQYIGIDDESTDDICRPHIGNIYPKKDPIWNIIRPLNHYDCRCGTIPVTDRYMKRHGLQISEPPSAKDLERIHPDFLRNPKNLEQYRKRLGEKLVEKEKKVEKISKQLKKRVKEGFRPAKTESEAKRFAKNMMDSGKAKYAPGKPKTRTYLKEYKEGKKDISGVRTNFDLGEWNTINKELYRFRELCDELDIPMVRGIRSRGSKSVVMDYGDGVLRINKKFPWDKVKTNAWKKGDPLSQRSQTIIGYGSSKPNRIKYSIWHEYGHHIQQYRQGFRQRLTDFFLKSKRKLEYQTKFHFPSKYSEEYQFEWFCENFGLYMNGRKELVSDLFVEFCENEDILYTINRYVSN